MDQTLTTKSRNTLFLLLLFLGGLVATNAQEVPFSARLNDGGNSYINIKGDYTFLTNTVMNRRNNSNGPNVPYNGNNSNNNFHVEYVDIDGDPTTFSSSSSTIALPTCSQIYYAGLYWAGNYDRDVVNTRYPASLPNDNSRYDFTTVKFAVPGGAYIDLVADNAADPVGQEDEIIIDGFGTVANSPYVCYKNVTGELQALADPNGEYFVANVRGTRGRTTYGVGGWTLVVIYENPTLTGKYISVFDGYEGVTTQSGNSVADINVVGFNTIPVGPVNARIGVSVLEGESNLSGDRFRIQTPLNPGFTNLSNSANPATNFFNSSITIDGTNVTTRNINGTNSMGYDSDIFDINNPANSIIDNGETSATLRLTTSSDWFASFLVTFGVDIIEPDILLEKRVEDIAGNDITGLGVNLGQILDYVLSFRNTGNDDATNYTIRDVLPLNVTLDETNMTLPSGVTYTYTPATREVVFTIPDNLIEEGDPFATIRMRVQVAENCFDFIDACTDLIENLAYSTYEGVINDNVISDDPSVSNFDNCGFVTPGATNFLLDDLSDCNFRRTVQLCGNDLLLDAGDGFDSYIWVSDDNGNGLFDPTDTVINDGDPDNDPSTMLVTTIGTYIVDKIVADPCKGFKEIFDVELFGSTQTNPIVDWFNNLNSDPDPTNDVQGQIVTCSVDGDLLPEIFLCGSNDSQLIQINITDAQSMDWEVLDEASCAAAPGGCANKNQTCTWNLVGTGTDYTANAAGKYRLTINYQNGCFSRFYFDVYQNILDIQYNENDIICTTNGNITITNLGANYGYQLVDVSNSTIVVPFSANNGPSFDFTAGQNGSYRVDVVQLDVSGVPIPGACIFSTPDIGILDRNFQVDITNTPETCNNPGSIQIDVLNVEPNYTYVLRLSDGTLVDDETAQPDNTHTFLVSPGDYIVEVMTDDGCFDSQNITVTRTPDPVLSAVTTAHIGCTAGTIELTVTGGLGNPDFNYAIWSKDGTPLYATVGDIPGGAYQVENIFAFGWRDTDGDLIDEYFPGEDGDYVFVVVDSNNCFAFSNEVTIDDNGAMTIAVTDDTPVSCNGLSDASITIVPTGGIGPYQYSIDGGANFVATASFVNLTAGSYDIQVQDTSGCDVTLTHVIADPNPLVAEAAITQIYTCAQQGEITVGGVTPTTGGSGSYQYNLNGGAWTPATPGGTVFSNLTDGTYTIRVRDANFITCSITLPDLVIDPLPTTPVPNTSIVYNCDGSGNITVLPNDPSYTYSLDAGAPQASNVFNNVAVGGHTVTIDYGSSCTIDTPVTISAGNAFTASVTGFTDVSCNGLSDGTITFEVENFDLVAGFDYSVDGGANYVNSTTSPVTTAAVFPAGNQTILIRKADDVSCATSISQNINEPAAVVANASITTILTCANGGATITAGVAGGTPTYTYQLEDNVGTPILGYDFATNGANTVFAAIPAGDYIVRVRDANLCEDPIDVALTVAPTNPITFTVTPTACYSGSNDATIQVDITNGNGDYQFSINSGPWVTPTPATATTHTFSNLANGTYTIDVQDGFGCAGVQQSVTIDPQLTVTATAPNITACATSTDITITAAGGDTNYVYAVMPTGVPPTPGDFATTNPVSVTSAVTADYDVHVRDNNGNAGYCDAVYTITVI
ncbi:MAG: SprB repeat-containing protein, partial [Aurantibacter sp.]